MKTIKKNGYYYLRYNHREGKKVITKEKYLGKEIPKNIEKIKKEFESEFFNDLNEKLELIREKFQEEWKKYPESIKEKVKGQIAIAFTYNTNAIEGSTITLEETREILEDKIAPNKPLRDIKETEKHAEVFLKMLNKKEIFSEELLLKWHLAIFEETKTDIAGKYRDYLVKVGAYRAPDWQDIEKLMKAFVKSIIKRSLQKYPNSSKRSLKRQNLAVSEATNFKNHVLEASRFSERKSQSFANGFIQTSLKENKINSVELAARLHYKFEKIHPFGDGNGRIGRLIINYILWHSGYPMLIIEYKKRRSYYKALQKNEDGFVQYFIRRYLNTHKKHLKSNY